MATYDKAPAKVREAISEAARLTGQSEELLAKIIGRESSFNPYAANKASSAKGLGQFLDSTWSDQTARVGGRYGITPETSRFDPRASAIMTAEYAKENARILERTLKRAPTPGEVYVSHFMGSGGALGLIRNAERNPDALAADIFPKQAAANPTIFFGQDGKTKRTMREVYGELTATADDTGVVRPLGNAAELPNIYSSEPVAPQPSFFERMKSGYVMAAEQEQSQTLAANYLMRMGDETLAPDDSFKWTPHLIKETTADLPEEYAQWVVENAHSAGHAKSLVERAKHDMANEAGLADYGLMGNLGLRGAAILTDVPTWLLGAGAGKLVGLSRMSRIAMAGRAGLIAAAEQAPIEFLKTQERPSYGLDDVALNTTSAFAFGAAFGSIFGKHGDELDAEFRREDMKMFRDVADSTGVKFTPDAEASLARSAGPRVATSGGAAATPPATGKSALRGLRVDVMGQLLSRPNREVQEVAQRIFLDAVGDGGETIRTGEVAFERMRRLSSTMDTGLRREVDDAYNEWATTRGLTTVQKVAQRKAFNEEVYRTLYMPSGMTEEPVSRAADAYRNGYRSYLQKAKASGAEWAKDIPEDELYVPMVFDRQRIREFVARYDEEGVISVLSQAFKGATKGLADDIARKAAEKYLRTIQGVTEGTNGSLVHVISGQDREGLKNLLVENGMSLQEVDAVVDTLKPSQKSGPSHARRRALLDDTTSFVPEGRGPGAAFSVRDLTVQDSEAVWNKYSRQMSGQIAMVEKGFQTRGAYETRIMEATKGQQHKVPGYTDTMADQDLKNLQYLGKTIYGIPTRDMDGTFGKIESILGSWNFMRFMGQSGVAQLGDVPKIMLKTSIASAYRSFRLSDVAEVFQRGGAPAEALTRELETITGVGTLNARGRVVVPYQDIEDFYPENLADTALDRAVRLSKTGANVTAMVSGMVPVTDFLGRWASRSAMQHLADVARGVKARPEKIMNDMGLGPNEIARFKSLIDKMDIQPNGIVRSLKLKDLQKIDPEGVDLLGAWVSRQARQIILEPDPGMLPRWMGDSSARLMMQFRTFSMASHAANTLHNLKMGPAYAAQSLLVTGAWAGLVYMGHTYAKSIGRPDQEEYLKRAYDPTTIAASAFSRSADAGMLPMIVDTAAMPLYAATGIESPFAYGRTTGLAAGIAGIPTVSGLIDLQKMAYEGIADPIREDKLATQEDAKRFARLLPLNNTYVISNAVAALSGLFPDSEPANEEFN